MDISCKRLKLHHLVTELKYEHIFEYFTIQKFSSQDSHTKSESAILKPKRLHDGQDHFFAPLLLDYL